MIAIDSKLNIIHLDKTQPSPKGFIPLRPSVYAWIHSQTRKIKEAHHAGSVPAQLWENTRTRFHRIQTIAVRQFSQAKLDLAVKDFESNPTDPFDRDASDAAKTPQGAASGFRDDDAGRRLPQSMTQAQIEDLLQNWDEHIRRFKELRVELELHTPKCGKITLTPEPTRNLKRKELAVEDAKILLEIREVFGEGVEIARFRDLRWKRGKERDASPRTPQPLGKTKRTS